MSGALAWGTDTTTARHQSSLSGTPVMSVISNSGKHHDSKWCCKCSGALTLHEAD